MGSRYLDYPSPRGVHVPESYPNNDDNDPYRRDSAHSQRRNRYSRSVHQTPRARDVTWISSPDPTPNSFHAPPTPWLPSPQALSSPAHRPPSVIPPSPAPTVGEHMAVDDVVFTQDDIMGPYTYQPQRQGAGGGLVKSFWKGLKKLSGFQSTPYHPRTSSYGSQTVEMPVPELSAPIEATRYRNLQSTPYNLRRSSYGSQRVEMPVPGLSAPSEASQYGNPTPPGTDEQHGATPYTSPYVRPTNLGATPAIIPGSLRASPGPVRSVEITVPITVVSPSIPPSPFPNSIRSVRMALPAMGTPRNLSARGLEPVAPPIEDGSQTLHEPVPDPIRPPLLSAFAPLAYGPKFPISNGPGALDSPSPSKGSLSSTIARFRRFVGELDDLPWVSDTQIADEFVPEITPRSQMRRRVRQGAEPSWYNPRPEVVERPEHWSEWDMWAKQSTAMLWDGVGVEGRAVRWGGAGGPGQWGAMYPHGYTPVQPGFVYPSGYPPPGVVNDHIHAPMLS